MEKINRDYFQNKYRIQSTRLPCWDYSEKGFYFVTICTYEQIHHFSEIIADKMHFNDIGYIAKIFLKQIPKHFRHVKIDSYIIMPNHIHVIIKIKGKPRIKQNNGITMPVETHNCASLQCINKFGPQSKNLSSIIRAFKSTLKRYANNHNIDFKWQARFYDNVIKDELALNQIRYYIIHNPENWAYDRNNLKKNE